MPQERLPLFPLGVVLLPGAALPLHIFEDRYKELIAEVIREEKEFGVVFASEKGMANIGCTATVERVLRRYPDGRSDILTRGRKRFEIVLLHEERSFLEASADSFGDEDLTEPSEHARQRALSAWTSLMVLENGGVPGDMPDANHPTLSFLLGDAVSDLAFRQQLLGMRSETERLDALLAHLPRYIEKEKLQRAMKRVAPLNGYGKHFYQA
jgi:Lon protease-like protein